MVRNRGRPQKEWFDILSKIVERWRRVATNERPKPKIEEEIDI